MSKFFGKGYLINPAPGAYTLTPTGAPAGYVAPMLRTPEIVDQEDAYQLLKDSLGVVEGIITPNDCILKCTFDFIPRGASVADAAKAATLPQRGGFGISGFAVIQVGLFSDAWNTGAGNTQPWFYLGGGTIRGAEDGQAWSMTLPLMRFYSITSATAIT